MDPVRSEAWPANVVALLDCFDPCLLHRVACCCVEVGDEIRYSFRYVPCSGIGSVCCRCSCHRNWRETAASSESKIEDRMHRMCPVYRWWQGYEREQGEVLREIRNKRATHKGKERPKQAKELSLALVRKRNETKRSKTRRDQGGATIGMQSSHRGIPKIRGFFCVFPFSNRKTTKGKTFRQELATAFCQ